MSVPTPSDVARRPNAADTRSVGASGEVIDEEALVGRLRASVDALVAQPDAPDASAVIARAHEAQESLESRLRDAQG